MLLFAKPNDVHQADIFYLPYDRYEKKVCKYALNIVDVARCMINIFRGGGRGGGWGGGSSKGCLKWGGWGWGVIKGSLQKHLKTGGG